MKDCVQSFIHAPFEERSTPGKENPYSLDPGRKADLRIAKIVRI